jgi:DNA-binding GntR family transcriptional regulator
VEFRTKAQIVFDELRRRIVAGTLKPGERMLLKSVAEEFECSEIPVREAFRSLAAIALVDLVPHGGAHVSVLRVEDIIELTEIRALLEPEAVTAALPHIGAQALAQLEELQSEMEAVAARADGVDFGRLNREFYGLIIDHSPNRKLAALINDLWARAERGRVVFRKGSEHLRISLDQHREMLAAIRAGRTSDLMRIATAHSQFGLQAVRQLARDVKEPTTAAAGGQP